MLALKARAWVICEHDDDDDDILLTNTVPRARPTELFSDRIHKSSHAATTTAEMALLAVINNSHAAFRARAKRLFAVCGSNTRQLE